MATSISLLDAKKTVKQIGMKELPQMEFGLPWTTDAEADWWVHEKDREVAVTNQWTKQGNYFQPTIVLAWWNNGKLYLYFQGVKGTAGSLSSGSSLNTAQTNFPTTGF